MTSINQNVNVSALSNFRNLEILLRILGIVDGRCLAAALSKTDEPLALMEELAELSAVVQPTLLISCFELRGHALSPALSEARLQVRPAPFSVQQ
jgi:hypothetical protein